MAATKKSENKGASKASSTKKSVRKTTASARGDKSVEAFRDALERSVTLSRDRLQEVVDDAVQRGRMTRTDANELVSRLVSRSRQQTDDLVKELERLLDQARRQVDARVAPARRRAERAASRAARHARSAAEPALAEADRLRRRAGVGASPITGYDALNASEVRSRLKGLKPAELRKVRTQERRGKGRKGVLDEIERQLEKK
jgi:polyhydroxyalkanoate synthesis regulator phasin